MGAYLSTSGCATHYNTIINCTYTINATNDEDNHVGGLHRGEVSSDSDVAGIGVR